MSCAQFMSWPPPAMRPARLASQRLTASRDRAQTGVTLVDVLVGLAVAMLTMVIVYRA